MSWYDNSTDFWHLVGDPGGYITGINKGGIGGIKKMLTGDPDAIKKAYDDAIAASKQGGQDIKNFLMDRENNAESYFNPYSSLLARTYGGGNQAGIAPPVLPSFNNGTK